MANPTLTRNHLSLDAIEEDECLLPMDDDPDGGAQDGADEVEEAVLPRKARDPGEPSDAERRQHETTHLPFRPWCRRCVLGHMNNPHTMESRGGGSM